MINGELAFFESDSLKMYNQGMVLYETALLGRRTYTFSVSFRDFMLIYVNNKFQGSLSRKKLPKSTFNVTCSEEKCKLKLLVEAMGHINYGVMQKTDRKGIVWFSEIDAEGKERKSSFKWNISTIPIDERVLEWK